MGIWQKVWCFSGSCRSPKISETSRSNRPPCAGCRYCPTGFMEPHRIPACHWCVPRNSEDFMFICNISILVWGVLKFSTPWMNFACFGFSMTFDLSMMQVWWSFMMHLISLDLWICELDCGDGRIPDQSEVWLMSLFLKLNVWMVNWLIYCSQQFHAIPPRDGKEKSY